MPEEGYKGWSANGIGRVFDIAVHTKNANIIWLCSPNGGLFYTKNRGKKWKQIPLPTPGGAIHIERTPIDQRAYRLFVASNISMSSKDPYSYGVFSTDNNGKTWDTIHPLFPSEYNLSTIGIMKWFNNQLIYSVNENVYRFTNGRQTLLHTAVVPVSGVSLEIGATTTTTYNSAGGIITNSNGGVIFNRKWNISPTSQPTSDVTVLYPFTNTEYSAIVTALSSKSTTITNANQLQMYKLTSSGTFADPHASGATGPVLTHGTNPSTENWVYSAHSNGTDHLATYKVSSFSGGGGGGGASGIALPLEFVSFDARAAAMHTANLQWATASEINNSHFEIERSYNGRTFEMIGQVAGKGKSHQQMEYNYIDNGIHPSNNIAYYRLKQVDFNGTSEYSTIQFVRFDELGSGIYFSAYPNPVSIELNIKIESNLIGSQFKIINALGQEVKQGELSNLNATIDVSRLPKGNYTMLIGSENYSHPFLVE